MANELGRKILGMFVDTEEPVPATSPSPAPQAPSAVGTSTASTFHQTMNPVPQVDQEMVDALQKVINARKTAYTALLEAAERLRTVIPDDVTRLKAAYAMISADGQRSLDGVLQAIDVHVNDVSGEVMRFNQSSEKALTAKVGTLRASAKSLLDTNDARAQQIQTYQQQVASLQQAISDDGAKSTDLTSQANTAEAEINGVAEKFKAAANFIKSDLAGKKAQLSSVLTT